MKPRDRSEVIVAACSDGVAEAMDVHRVQFSLGTVADLVPTRRTEPADEIVRAVHSAIHRFSAEGPDGDDRVMLILIVNSFRNPNEVRSLSVIDFPNDAPASEA